MSEKEQEKEQLKGNFLDACPQIPNLTTILFWPSSEEIQCVRLRVTFMDPHGVMIQVMFDLGCDNVCITGVYNK